jgi:hypothetical protein
MQVRLDLIYFRSKGFVKARRRMDPDAIDPVVRKYASELGLDRHPNSERSQPQSSCAIPARGV